MKRILLDFLSDIFEQLFGNKKPRSGKLRLTHNAVTRMHEHRLDEATIEDAFRHGEQVKEKTIVRKYANYSVGLIFYKPRAVTYNFKPFEFQPAETRESGKRPLPIPCGLVLARESWEAEN